MLDIDHVSEEKRQEVINFFDFYFDGYFELLNDISNEYRKEVCDKEFYKYYRNIIDNSSKLIKELGLNDPISTSVLVEYLLWNGYLSKDKNLVYSISNRKNVMGLPGADIMLGKSVCLNNAALLTDILNASNFEAYTLGCKLPSITDKIDFEYRPIIERNIIDPNFIDKIIQAIPRILHLEVLGNHAVTCFQFCDRYLVCDPTTLAFANFTGIKDFSYVGANLNAKIKAYLMILLNDLTYDKFKDIIVRIFAFSDKEILDVDNYRKISEAVLSICYKNLNLLNDFHGSILNDIDGVCKTLKNK